MILCNGVFFRASQVHVTNTNNIYSKAMCVRKMVFKNKTQVNSSSKSELF